MANTFKFGNGNWAVKDGFALAYNDENNNFKPLPFDFTRASSATRVNKQGLIETVPSGKPRIDFTDNTSGHLLIEPSRTNIQPYSEQFDNSAWTKGNSSISANQTTSPDGSQTADKWIEASDTSVKHQLYDFSNISSAGTYHFSCFFKKSERTRIAMGSISGGAEGAIFDLDNGSIVRASDGITTASKIEDFGNGWYRCIVTIVTTGAVTVGFTLVSSGTTTTYNGDGSSGLFIWGAMIEAGSYATSYIPTEGSSVTRVVETTNATVPSGVFGTSEGTIYAEGVVAVEEGSGQMAFTAGTDTSNLIYIWIQANGRLTVESYTSTVQCGISSSIGILSVGDSYKIAFGYANNDFVLYLNGTQIGTDTSGSIAVPSNVKVGTYIASGYAGGKIKQTKIYDTRLTDTELQNLTS